MAKYLDKAGLQRVVDNLRGKLASYVPTARKINDYPLTRDIALDADDVGAASKEFVQQEIQAAIIESWVTEI